MGEIIVVTSGKGGVGKTTTTANIGCGLASAGKSVVLIDADIGLRNLDVIMGLENRIVYDLVDVVLGNCRIKQALIKDKRFENLYLLAAAQSKDKDAVSPEQMVKLVASLVDDHDYIIIDCPAGIEQGFRNAVSAANRAIVVAVPEVTSVRDADRVVGLLEADDFKNIQLVLNRLRPEMVKRGEMLSLEAVVEVLSIDVLGIVPDDESIIISSNNGEPTTLNQATSKAGAAYLNIVQRIMDERVPMITLEAVEEIKSSGGFMSKLKKMFKKDA
ncbi:MAG: septum site-determining protein MinD [Defluviitaleaceae bacterium]|nr:septum site-determining protein MinD [Defluviitaleaceae bacterium]